MFSTLLQKLTTFAYHHQAFVASLVTFSLICITWGSEKILERYLFPRSPLYGYLFAIGLGIILLWMIQHYILHSI
jgi:hypothetical protein